MRWLALLTLASVTCACGAPAVVFESMARDVTVSVDAGDGGAQPPHPYPRWMDGGGTFLFAGIEAIGEPSAEAAAVAINGRGSVLMQQGDSGDAGISAVLLPADSGTARTLFQTQYWTRPVSLSESDVCAFNLEGTGGEAYLAFPDGGAERLPFVEIIAVADDGLSLVRNGSDDYLRFVDGGVILIERTLDGGTFPRLDLHDLNSSGVAVGDLSTPAGYLPVVWMNGQLRELSQSGMALNAALALSETGFVGGHVEDVLIKAAVWFRDERVLIPPILAVPVLLRSGGDERWPRARGRLSNRHDRDRGKAFRMGRRQQAVSK